MMMMIRWKSDHDDESIDNDDDDNDDDYNDDDDDDDDDDDYNDDDLLTLAYWAVLRSKFLYGRFFDIRSCADLAFVATES